MNVAVRQLKPQMCPKFLPLSSILPHKCMMKQTGEQFSGEGAVTSVPTRLCGQSLPAGQQSTLVLREPLTCSLVCPRSGQTPVTQLSQSRVIVSVTCACARLLLVILPDCPQMYHAGIVWILTGNPTASTDESTPNESFEYEINIKYMNYDLRESLWHRVDPRCVPGEVGSSEVQRLGQVVRDMDGQFGSDVHYVAGRKCLLPVLPPGQDGNQTPAVTCWQPSDV